MDKKYTKKKRSDTILYKLKKRGLGLNKMEDFQEILAAYLSLSGFTEEAGDFCLKHGIAVADKIVTQ